MTSLLIHLKGGNVPDVVRSTDEIIIDGLDEVNAKAMLAKVGACTGLKRLTIHTYNLASWEGLAQLPQLETLTCSTGEMQSLPQEIGTLMPQLQVLQLQSVQRLKKLPPSMGELQHLRTLDIYMCPDISSVPKELEGCGALEGLLIRGPEDVWDSEASKAIPKELFELKPLRISVNGRTIKKAKVCGRVGTTTGADTGAGAGGTGGGGVPTGYQGGSAVSSPPVTLKWWQHLPCFRP